MPKVLIADKLSPQAIEVFKQNKVDVDVKTGLPPEELLAICVEVILVRRRGSHYRRDTILPDVVEEFASETFRACLKQTVQQWQPDLVQLEFTQMAQYADACHPAKTILVEHDITFDLQQQLLAIASEATWETAASRLELEKQLGKWKAFETEVWKRVDCVVAMSPKDEGMVSGYFTRTTRGAFDARCCSHR